MNRTTWRLTFALLLAGVAGCPAAEPEPRGLVLTGAPSMAPLLREVGKRFEEAHPDVRVTVQPSTSGKAGADVRQGLADVGMVARRPQGDELSLHATPLALDGLALVVHKSNPVRPLSDEEVAGLYLRTFTNWKQLGAGDRLVVLVEQFEGRSARDLFRAHFGLKTSALRPDQVVAGSAQVIQALAGLPGGIGYASVGPAEAAAPAQPIRLLPLRGVSATLENLANGTYPLRRPLDLVTREPPRGLPGEFIDFARSSACHDLVRKHGFLPTASSAAGGLVKESSGR